MTARTEIVTALTALVPAGVRVLPYAREIDPPTAPTVMVRVDKVRPSPLPQALREYQVALVLVASKTDPGPADDELDALLEDILQAVYGSPSLIWSEATRAVYQDTYPAYEVTLTVTTTREASP